MHGLRSGPLHVTAYVEPGGTVVSAGVASGAQAEAVQGADAPPDTSEGVLDCVAGQVKGWELPDPGSYPGKVTFDLR